MSHSAQNPLHPPPLTRKPITLPSEETLPTNERLLYFSPNESDASRTLSSLVSMTTGGGACDADEPELAGNKMEASPGVKAGTAAALHDTILATQLRHINRELTPTISEVGVFYIFWGLVKRVWSFRCTTSVILDWDWPHLCLSCC